MATSAPPQSKPAATRKASAAPRKSSTTPDKGGKPIQLRYYTIMKPQRVYALVVEVPTNKRGGSSRGGGTVVVRPTIAGAQVVPPEQRFDTSEAGNQVTFYVTPLARGRLPRARVEIHAAGQEPQEVLLPMKARTQRLAWFLVVLAILVPWLLVKFTTGDWRPEGTAPNGSHDSAVVLGSRIWSGLREDLVEIPLFNKPLGKDDDWTKDAGRKLTEEEQAKKDREKAFTVAGTLADGIEVAYKGLDEGVRNRWQYAAAVILLLLAFVSWSFHRARKVRVRHRLDLAPAAEAGGEPVTLEPL